MRRQWSQKKASASRFVGKPFYCLQISHGFDNRNESTTPFAEVDHLRVFVCHALQYHLYTTQSIWYYIIKIWPRKHSQWFAFGFGWAIFSFWHSTQNRWLWTCVFFFFLNSLNIISHSCLQYVTPKTNLLTDELCFVDAILELNKKYTDIWTI